TGGVQTKAAELLKMTFRQFRYKLQKHSLVRKGSGGDVCQTLTARVTGRVNPPGRACGRKLRDRGGTNFPSVTFQVLSSPFHLLNPLSARNPDRCHDPARVALNMLPRNAEQAIFIWGPSDP